MTLFLPNTIESDPIAVEKSLIPEDTNEYVGGNGNGSTDLEKKQSENRYFTYMNMYFVWHFRVQDLKRMNEETKLREQSNKLLFTYKSPYFESSIDVTSNDRVGVGILFDIVSRWKRRNDKWYYY